MCLRYAPCVPCVPWVPPVSLADQVCALGLELLWLLQVVVLVKHALPKPRRRVTVARHHGPKAFQGSMRGAGRLHARLRALEDCCQQLD